MALSSVHLFLLALLINLVLHFRWFEILELVGDILTKRIVCFFFSLCFTCGLWIIRSKRRWQYLGFAGESPSSSSASDVDNLNNQSLVPSDKGTVTQVGRIGMASPQTMPGAVAPSSHSMVPSHLRSSFIRVLKDVCSLSLFSFFTVLLCTCFLVFLLA